MLELPSGTITLLFTDIEGSTRLWERYPAAMAAAIARHDAILREAIVLHSGHVFRTVGDAFFAAFAGALDALRAALAAQHGLHAEPWAMLAASDGAQPRPAPARAAIAVRMGLHTSHVDLRDGEYYGPPLNRVARLMAAGHGGQTLLCHDTAALVQGSLPPGVCLRDMGLHRLKDLRRPIRIYQLGAEELPDTFPPLKTLSAAAPAGGDALRQAKLPGMPGVDYDALWRREKERQRRRHKRKSSDDDEGGLF